MAERKASEIRSEIAQLCDEIKIAHPADAVVMASRIHDLAAELAPAPSIDAIKAALYAFMGSHAGFTQCLCSLCRDANDAMSVPIGQEITLKRTDERLGEPK